MSLESDKKLHISKSIPISSIIQIGLIVFGIATVYGQNQSDISNIKKDVEETRQATIDKETIKQMFENKDLQIKNLAEKVEKVDKNLSEKIDKNQRLLIELLQRTPKPQ